MSSNSTITQGHNSKPLVIVLAGRTFAQVSQSTGDFDNWIANGLGGRVPIHCVDAHETPDLPLPAEIAGVVVSGSHAMVTDRAPWSERLAQWLKTCVETNVPVLGICYGHQLLAHALGGRVGNHPQGIELGTKRIDLLTAADRDPLFTGLPRTFSAQLVHVQSVLELPPEAVLLARSEHEPHQAYRVGSCAWGLQFHPEFPAAAMQGYIDQIAAAEGEPLADAGKLNDAVAPTPEAASLLPRFAALVLAHDRNEALREPALG